MKDLRVVSLDCGVLSVGAGRIVGANNTPQPEDPFSFSSIISSLHTCACMLKYSTEVWFPSGSFSSVNAV